MTGLCILCDLLCPVLDGLKVQENEDNLAVLHAARDSLKLIQNKFLPTVCSWVQVRFSTWSPAVNLGSKTRQSKDVEGGNTHLGGDEHFPSP